MLKKLRWLWALALIALVAPAAASADALVGNTTTEPTQAGTKSGVVRADQFTAAESGTSATMSLELSGNPDKTLYLGVYGDNNGAPGGLLARGSTATTGSGWTTATVSGAGIVSGGKYWLAIMGTGSWAVSYRDAWTPKCKTVITASGKTSLPGSWPGTASSDTRCLSLYLSGSGTPPAPSGPVRPRNSTLPAISGTLQAGDTLTASTGTWTGDTPMSFSYKWSDGATGKTDALTSADVGQSVSVSVTATNDAGSVSATSASVGPVTAPPPPPSPPSNTQLPVISGTPQQGDTLTVSKGSWTGSPTSYTYSWSDGTTGSSDTLSVADVGQTITATVTASNSAGAGLPATSAGVGPVTAAGPPPPPPIGSGQSFVNDLAWAQSQAPITASGIPWKGITQMVLFSLSSCTTTVTSACPTVTSIDTSRNGVDSINLSQWVSTVHSHGAKAVITMGGSTNPDWGYVCNPTDAATFAQNLVNYAQSNGFDDVDLDIEQSPGSGLLTTAGLQDCASDASADAHAAGLRVSADFGAGYLDSTSAAIGPYVDQGQLMSFGESISQIATNLTRLENDTGLPASKILIGMESQGGGDGYPEPDCGGIANYANDAAGAAGVMLWELQADANEAPAGTYPCLNAIAPYVAPGS